MFILWPRAQRKQELLDVDIDESSITEPLLKMAARTHVVAAALLGVGCEGVELVEVV
jgi:hypothetical protein